MCWLLSYLKRKLCKRKLTEPTPADKPAQAGSLVEMLQASPHREIDLTPERCKDTGRDVTFE